MKKIIVISLGGSLIIPEKDNLRFLNKFKKTLQLFYKTHKFAIITGGGSLARRYISILRAEKKSIKELSLAGIKATQTNAQFVMQIFGKKEANDFLPKSMKQIKSLLKKNKVVICGALRYSKNSTSDSTAAVLSNYLKADFINITNIKGLYDKNPKTSKSAKFIPRETWKNFERRALSLRFKAGQHFVLDQNAAVIIKKQKIKTYIVGPEVRNLYKILKGKEFTGTLISG